MQDHAIAEAWKAQLCVAPLSSALTLLRKLSQDYTQGNSSNEQLLNAARKLLELSHNRILQNELRFQYPENSNCIFFDRAIEDHLLKRLRFLSELVLPQSHEEKCLNAFDRTFFNSAMKLIKDLKSKNYEKLLEWCFHFHENLKEANV
jgi:hypothetical protein